MNEKTKQLNMLYDQIIGNIPSSGKDKIDIYPIEAGLGKTTYTEKALIDLYKQDPNIKALLVTKLIKEAKRLQKTLGGIALAIYSGKKKTDENKIINTPVIIITHRRFKDLCDFSNPKSKCDWKLYSEGRKNLIIDEELDLLKIISLKQEEYDAAKRTVEKLDSYLGSKFDYVFSQINDAFNNIKINIIRHDLFLEPYLIDYNRQVLLNRLIKTVISTQNNTRFYNMISTLHDEMAEYYFLDSYEELFGTLLNMKKILFSKQYIINKYGLFSINSECKYRLLENNIMLDASANILAINKYNETLNVLPMKRIIDYSNWELNVCNFNTSKNNKLEKPEIYRSIKLQIELICNNVDNKLLVIGSKADVGNLDEEGKIQKFYPELCEKYKTRIAFVNFEAMRGRNDWLDYNTCLIIHTYYRPSYFYPLQLQFNKEDYNFRNINLKMNRFSERGKGHYGYINSSTLDEIRETDLVSTLYQASKRINRKNDMAAKIYLITNNVNAINLLRKELPGIKTKEFKLPEHELSKKKGYAKTENQNVKILKAVFVDMLNGDFRKSENPNRHGHYPKKFCMEMIDYFGTHSSRYIKPLEDFMITNGITQNKHNIIVLKYCKKD